MEGMRKIKLIKPITSRNMKDTPILKEGKIIMEGGELPDPPKGEIILGPPFDKPEIKKLTLKEKFNKLLK